MNIKKKIEKNLKLITGDKVEAMKMVYDKDIGDSHMYETTFDKGGKEIHITMEYFTLHPPDISILFTVDGDKKIGRHVTPDELDDMFDKMKELF